MTPNWGGCCFFRFSQQLLHLSLGTFLKSLELTRRPSRALALGSCVALGATDMQGHVRCVAVGLEIPGLRQKQLTQTLIAC